MGFRRVAYCLALLAATAVSARAQVGESVIATVNDELITTYDVRQRAALMLALSNAEPTPEIQQLASEQALRGLIDEKLQLQEARTLSATANASLVPDDPAIDEALELLAAQSGTDLETNMTQLRALGVDESTLRDQMRAQIAWERLIQGRFSDRVALGSEVVDEAMAELIASLAEPQYRVAEIVFDVDAVADEPAARAEVMGVIEQLRAGGNFPALAQQVSDSPSADRGGDLGFQPIGAFPPEVGAALESLAIGEVAGPIRTAGAFYIVALIEKRDASTAEQLTLKAVVLPVAEGAADADREAARVRLGEAAEGAAGCDAADAIAGRVEGAFVSDLGSLSRASLQPQVQEALADIQPGGVSAAISSQLGAQVFLLCDRSVGGPSIPSREEIAARMEDQRLAMLSRRYLRDLHREALIEMRGEEGE